MNWSTDPLSLSNKVLLRLLLWVIKHHHCHLQSAGTCPLRTGLSPAGRVTLTQIKLHMFKGLQEWTMASHASQIILNLQHHPHGVTVEQKDRRETRRHSPQWIKIVPKIEIDNIATFPSKSDDQQIDFWSFKKVYALPISTALLVISGNEHYYY